MTQLTESRGFLDRHKHYVVSRKTTDFGLWTYQIYQSRLDDYSAKGPFSVVVIGDAGLSTQRILAIPIEHLRRHVFPHAAKDSRNRYTFEVNKTTLEVTWRYRIHMDGRPFLV